MVDVFATFVPCTQGVTPSFATQDDYSATDAFSASQAAGFVCHAACPTDGCRPAGSPGSLAPCRTTLARLQRRSSPVSSQSILLAGFRCGSSCGVVLLASIRLRFSWRESWIPVTAGAAGEPPNCNLNAITIDNLSRLFYVSSFARGPIDWPRFGERVLGASQCPLIPKERHAYHAYPGQVVTRRKTIALLSSRQPTRRDLLVRWALPRGSRSATRAGLLYSNAAADLGQAAGFGVIHGLQVETPPANHRQSPNPDTVINPRRGGDHSSRRDGDDAERFHHPAFRPARRAEP